MSRDQGDVRPADLTQTEVGEELPTFTVNPSLIQVVMYAAAMWEYQRIHFDQEWAEREGLPGPIVHGPLLGNYLVQAVTYWAGETAAIRHLEWRNRGLALIGEPLSCEGVVTATASDTDTDTRTIKLDLWIDNPRNDRLVTGSATIVVTPVRSSLS